VSIQKIVLTTLVVFGFTHATNSLALAQNCESQFIAIPAVVSAKEQKAIDRLRKETAKYFQANLKLPDDTTAKQLEQILQGDVTTLKPLTIEELVASEPAAANVVRSKIVSAYLKFVRIYQRTPSSKELGEHLDISEVEVSALLGEKRLFTDLADIKVAAVKKNPRAFDKVIDSTFFDAKAMARTVEVIQEAQTLLITTAIPYTPVSEHMLATLKTMAKKKKAKIVVLPAFMQTTGLDPKLLNDPDIHILVNTTVLNPYLRIDNIKIMPKMVNPDASLDQYGPRGQSVIVAAPQVRLKTVPTIENDNFPHFVMTTGAITQPIYNSRIPIQGRQDALAADRHNMAVLLIEKSRGDLSEVPPIGAPMTGFFHFRHIHYVEGKGMVDKGTLYSPEGTAPAQVKALILSDSHIGMAEPMFVMKIVEAVKALKPDRIGLEDVFNGHSISHHEAKNVLSATAKVASGKHDLARELKDVATFINSLMHLDTKLEVRIVLSNHDMWIDKWLDTGEFMKDPHNRALGVELAAAVVRGESPFEYGLTKFGLEYPKRVTFVTGGTWNEAGVQLGQHGHQGANGARNSMLTMKRATDKSVHGHSHTTQILGHTVNVGTGSLLRPGYTGTGASSWSHSIAAVNDLGVTQVFVLRNGEWWTSQKVGNDPTFFPQGFPKVIPPTDPSLGPQIDQYSQGKH
jgi:hypothetical protein